MPVGQARRAQRLASSSSTFGTRSRGASLAALVSDLVAVTRGSTTRVVVNDSHRRWRSSQRDGVHLRGDSISVAAAGVCCRRHSSSAGPAHGPRGERGVSADYLVAGSVFPRRRSQARRAAWRRRLRAIVRATAVPVLAIGGITPDRIAEVVAAGAAGIAAIGSSLTA